MYLSLCLCVCPCICVCVCLSVYLSVCLCVRVSLCPCISLAGIKSMQRDLNSIFRRFRDVQSEIACPPVHSLWFQVVKSSACVRTSINIEFFSLPNIHISVFLFSFFLSFFLFFLSFFLPFFVSFLSFFRSLYFLLFTYLLFTYFCGYFYIYLLYFSSDFYFFMFLNTSVFHIVLLNNIFFLFFSDICSSLYTGFYSIWISQLVRKESSSSFYRFFAASLLNFYHSMFLFIRILFYIWTIFSL